MLTILTDTTSDLSPEQCRVSGVRTMPVPIQHMGEEFQEGEITPAELLQRVKSSGQAAVTRAPTVDECVRVYQQALVSADEVLHLTTSSGISGTYEIAKRAAAGFSKVTVMDSRTGTYGLGLLALRAAKWADQGLSIPEIMARVEDLRQNMLLVFAVEKLDYLRINGRVSPATAFVGNLLGFQPIVRIADGITESVGRGRGQAGALKELSKIALKFQTEQAKALEIAYIYTAGGEAGVQELVTTLDYLHAKSLGIYPMGAGISANGGPAYGMVMLPAETVLV